MTESLLPETQVIQEFAQRRMRQLLAAVPALLAFAAAYWTVDHPERTFFGFDRGPVMTVGIVLFVAYVVFSLVNWRCPACHCYLGKAMNPRFCAKCGVRFRA